MMMIIIIIINIYYCTYCVRVNLKWIINITERVKNIILIEENIKVYFRDLGINKYVLSRTHTKNK